MTVPDVRAQAKIVAFFKEFDVYKYSQPDVADILGVSQNDINQWRSRGLLSIGWEKNGRVAFTGRGLVVAGIMAELSWLVGPETASKAADTLLNWLTGFADRARAGEPVWEEEPFFFRRPVWGRKRIVRLEHRGVLDMWDDAFGLTLYQASLEAVHDPASTLVWFPLPTAIVKWALVASLHMERFD